ncbi:MAG: heme lyase CcmF/NrfE family subunit, partial [SAR202 cluster bacterium]|nr:heme lyase CcmF/NrfE family subunit [SAR202 cluster bacterium]
MADLGAISLWIALALAAYSTVGSVAGKLRLSPALVESAQSAMYAAGLALMVATLSLVVSFISRDFEIAYVAAHSDLAMANKFTWVAFYAGNEGSLLYIATILSIMSAVAVWRAPEKFKDALPYTTAILMLTLTFFVAVMAVMANPFDKLPFVPLDGDGINPLLTHFGMFFHPPALMAGLIGITVPFAFAIGSLLAGKTGDEWVDAGRVWGMVSWVLLAGGLLLGSWWAYTILGWGGFWFWDPVENAAFMPWLGITAFIHSIMVQKRRGMFRMWNIVLINVAFGLALYGMFMNRGGSVPSVHSFGASQLGWIFLLFLAVGVIVPFAIFIWRYPLLKSVQNLDSMLSREAAFLVNNMLLLAIAFVTLWGTVYPLLSRLTNDEEITVARPFYDQVNGPLMLGLVFLMGVGPLIPWRKAGMASLRRSLLPPVVGGLLTVGILAALGLHKDYALIAFGLATFVTTGILMEWFRGTRSR